ncbi:MAG: protein kinase [Deltaproteobacteria bacterium]|nr:protein kinase [Deltaproteobacteria bacterium]
MPQVGDALGRYVLLKKLAVGGMGEIFLAAKTTPLGFAPPVALKVLREELASDQVFVDMLIDEANITKYLNHQNVVSVLDFGEDKKTYFIAMEYVQGITLKDLLTRARETGRRPDLSIALYIGSELCRALRYAHTRVNHRGEPMNIVHRDVTPGNVLLSTQGEVKLTDFGIARAKGRIHQTQAGVLKGKFGYMAPEMVRYERIDARADLFCVGVVLYELVTGQHPVEGESIMDAIGRFERGAIDPASRLNPDVPERLDYVLKKALEPRAESRWESAMALGNELQELALKTKQGREDLKGASRGLSEAIRTLVPSAFDPPVPRDTLDRLLEEARAREERDKKAAAAKPAPPVEVVAPKAAPANAPEDDRPFLFRPIVNDSSEVPTGEGLSVEDSIGPTLIPSGRHGAPTRAPAPEIVGPSRDDLSAIQGAFADTSTDRQRVHDDLLDEPSLPGTDNTMPLKAVRPEVEERTVATADYEQIKALEAARVEDDGDVPTFMKTGERSEPIDPAERGELLAEEALPVGTNLDAPTNSDDKTISGMMPAEIAEATVSMPRIESVSAPVVVDLSPAASADIPGLSLELMHAVREAAEQKSEGDATLLDGIKLSDIEAERKKLEEAGQLSGPTSPPTARPSPAQKPSPAAKPNLLEEPTLDRAPSEDSGYSDDSTQAYIYEPELARAVAEPARLTGPLTIKLGADGEPEGKPKSIAPAPRPEPQKRPIDAAQAKKATSRPDNPTPISAADDEAAKLLVSTRNKISTPPPPAAPRPRQSEPTPPPRAVAPQPRPYAPPAVLAPPVFTAPPAGLGMSVGAKVAVGLSVLVVFLVLLYSQRVGWPSIEIQSDPQGATVILDGDTLSQPTPLRATVRPFQAHEIRFVRKGYVSETLDPLSLSLFAQETKLIVLKRPEVEVRISPVEAEVLVNGKPAGKGRSAVVIFDGEDGNLLEVRAAGYAPWSTAYGPGEAPGRAVDVVLSALPPPAPPPQPPP